MHILCFPMAVAVDRFDCIMFVCSMFFMDNEIWRMIVNVLLFLLRFETFDGTAEAGQDYIPKKGQLIFEPGETTKNIEIEIIDDYEWEPDETFFVKLNVDTKGAAIVGKHSIIEVTIINDDGKRDGLDLGECLVRVIRSGMPAFRPYPDFIIP